MQITICRKDRFLMSILGFCSESWEWSYSLPWGPEWYKPHTWTEVCSALHLVWLPCFSHICLNTDVSGDPWAASEPIPITGHALFLLDTGEQHPIHETLPVCLGWHSQLSAPGRCYSLSLQDHCGYCPLEKPVLLSVSEGSNKCTLDSAVMALCILPSQNWHQLPTVMVAHFTSVLVPENKW